MKKPTLKIMSTAHLESAEVRQWPRITREFLDHSYQQTLPYTRAMACRHGATNESVAIVESGRIIGAANVRIRKLPIVGGGLAYIAAGPLTRRGEHDDRRNLATCLEVLRDEYVHRRRMTLRVLGPLGPPQSYDPTIEAFESAGMTRAHERARGYRTFILSLAKTEDELRANCSKYWRRNLRRGEKREFEIVTGSEQHLLESVADLQGDLIERKALRLNLDAAFYARLQQSLSSQEQLWATLLRLDGNDVAGMIVSMLGDTCVPLVLATSRVGLREYAAYRLQWESIITAKRCGCECYDLGGIDKDDNKSVFDFKSGLRGVEIQAPGPFETRSRGLRGALLPTLETAYRRVHARAA